MSGRIDATARQQMARDGFVLLRGAFSATRVESLRAGVASLLARARAGDCEIRWIDEDRRLPNRVSHMLHPDKYEAAWGDWISEDLVDDMEALLESPVRHSLFGMLASGGGDDYRMAWHRDLGKPGAPDEEAFLRRHDGRSIQFNAPVAGVDTFLHVVPGSHVCASTSQEIAAADAGLDGDMPGGVEVRLEPGDILYYNANLWHRGWNPEGRLRWTMHAACWRADVAVMTHEHGQLAALGTAEHLQRLPERTRQLVQRYLEAHTDTPTRLQDA